VSPPVRAEPRLVHLLLEPVEPLVWSLVRLGRRLELVLLLVGSAAGPISRPVRAGQLQVWVPMPVVPVGPWQLEPGSVDWLPLALETVARVVQSVSRPAREPRVSVERLERAA